LILKIFIEKYKNELNSGDMIPNLGKSHIVKISAGNNHHNQRGKEYDF
jgi:hypothetical protein